nr:unnamed protein product [Callosobruchus chinensis]
MHPDCISTVTSKIHGCPICVYKTMDKAQLQKHLSKHSREASLPCKLHSCKSCDYKSSSKSSLDCHIVRKHPDYISSVTSKIHECSKCLYKTMRSREFQTHLLKHSRKGSSTLVPHRCTHCNVEAKGKRGLNCHISKKHPDFNATVTSKIHECSHCGFKTINS